MSFDTLGHLTSLDPEDFLSLRLSSTQIYTKVTALTLKEVHQKTHPAKLEKSDAEEGEAED